MWSSSVSLANQGTDGCYINESCLKTRALFVRMQAKRMSVDWLVCPSTAIYYCISLFFLDANAWIMPCDHSAAGCLHTRRRRGRGRDYWLRIRKGAHHYFSALIGETIALSVRHAAFCMRICKRRKEQAQRNNSRKNLSQTWLRPFVEPNHWNKYKEGSTRVSRRKSNGSHEKSVTDVWGTAQNDWYILHRHQSPLQKFIIMHAFIV
jgi:hypothetical protein